MSLPLHWSKRLDPIFTVGLIRLHHLTLFVGYNFMMPWPLHCKIREEPIHHKKELKYTFTFHWVTEELVDFNAFHRSSY